MTLHEGGVVEAPEIVAEQAPDFDYFLTTYGLGPQELDTIVVFGEHTGTIAAMLEDKRCPVGNFVAQAYKTEGLAGVEARLEGFKRLSSGFEVNVSPDTRAYHEGTIDRRTLLQKTTPTEQAPITLDAPVESQADKAQTVLPVPETTPPSAVIEAFQRTAEQHTREVVAATEPSLHKPSVQLPRVEQTHRPRPAKRVIAVAKPESKVRINPVAVAEKSPVTLKEVPAPVPPRLETRPGQTIDLWPASQTIKIAKLAEVPVAKAMVHKAETVDAEPVAVEWLAELYKPPVEVFENFTLALQNFIKLPSPESDEGIIEEPLSPITVVLAERLSELEPEQKDEIGSMMLNIAGAIHGIQVLEARGASAEEITDAQQQLQEFCIVLLEALKIEYTEADVHMLMELVLQDDFKPEQAVVHLLDLERAGTHEVKLFKKLATGYYGVENRLQRILGMFALL